MTQSPHEAPLPPYDPNLFDRQCRNYLYYKEAERSAKASADEIKAQLIRLVELHGVVPTGAEKSRRVEERRYVATVTSGTSIVIDDAKVLDLELLLSRIRRSDAFKYLFERRVEYTLAKTAREAMETTAWPRKHSEQVKSLYAACFSPKPKTPSLEVVTREAIQEREAKDAAKKAKPGKKAA